MRQRLPVILLAVVLLGSAGAHAYYAANPTTSYQSADERSYGRLAIALAEDHHYGGRGVAEPLHWPPGAPTLFALAHTLAGDDRSLRTDDIPAAYWFQGLISVGTTLLAALLAWLLAGAAAGVLTAAMVGFYPPLILATGEQLSEPLGAFFVVAAFLVLALAVRQDRRWLYAAAGAVFGFAVLTRTDLLPIPFLLAGLLGVSGWRRRGDGRRGVALAAVYLGGYLAALAPWTLYASYERGSFTPVTSGSASALFVGTYLPGKGTTVGMKRDLQEETWARYPSLAGTPGYELPARKVLGVVAARNPHLPYQESLSLEGRRNLRRYVLSDPVDFAAMMVDKGIQRMWSRYARGGARHTSPWIRGWHIALVLLAFTGLGLGAVKLRSVPILAVLVTALVATGVHAIVVSQARYNLPLMPAVLAGGITGWFLFRSASSASSRRSGSDADRPPSSPLPSASGS